MTDTPEHTLHVTWDQVDHIMVSELKKTMEYMDDSLNRYEEQDVLRHIFSHDDEEDKALIKAHRDAAKLLLSYYGVGNE